MRSSCLGMSRGELVSISFTLSPADDETLLPLSGLLVICKCPSRVDDPLLGTLQKTEHEWRLILMQ